MRACQNGSIAPPRKFEKLSPRTPFELNFWKSVHICNSPRRTKKPQGLLPIMQQEVRHFEFRLIFSTLLCHFLTFFKRYKLKLRNSDRAEICTGCTPVCRDQKLSKRSAKVWGRGNGDPRNAAILKCYSYFAILGHFQTFLTPIA